MKERSLLTPDEEGRAGLIYQKKIEKNNNRKEVTSDIRQELARLWLPYTLSTVQVACNFNTVMTCTINFNTVDFNYSLTFKIQVIKNVVQTDCGSHRGVR